MLKILPRFHFGLFHCEGWGFSLSILHMQRRDSFVLKPCLASNFLCLDSIFHHLVPQSSYFAIICHTEWFPCTWLSRRWSYGCFEQLPIHLRVCCAFQLLSEQGRCVVYNHGKALLRAHLWRRDVALSLLQLQLRGNHFSVRGRLCIVL